MDASMSITNPENKKAEAGVERAFRHLEAVVAMLDDNVGRLEHRLSPISVDRTSPMSDSESPSPQPAELSPIAGSLESTAETIGRLSNRINEAIYRLDI